MRTITIAVNNVPDITKYWEAIDYLKGWNKTGYDKLIIFDDPTLGSKFDMVAVYENTQNGSSYVIGAVWSEEKQSYSFHS